VPAPASTPRATRAPSTSRTRRTSTFLAAFALTAAHPRDASASDDWFGRDKALHAGVSAALAGGAYALSSPFLETRAGRAAFGAGFSLAVGAVKEGYDALGYGDPSWKDFAWDAIGTFAGVLVAWGIDLAIGGVDAREGVFGRPKSAAGALVITF
jgi:putative lipoprotein